VYETRHFTIDFFPNECYELFSISSISIEKKIKISLTSETEIMNTEGGGGAQNKNWHKRNIFYNQIPFYMNNNSFYSFKEQKYKLSVSFDLLVEVNKSHLLLFLKNGNT